MFKKTAQVFVILSLVFQFSFISFHAQAQHLESDSNQQGEVKPTGNPRPDTTGAPRGPVTDGLITLATVKDVVNFAKAAELDAANAEDEWKRNSEEGPKPERFIDIAYLENTDPKIKKLFDLLVIEMKNRNFQIRKATGISRDSLISLAEAWEVTSKENEKFYGVQLNEERFKLRKLSTQIRDAVSKILGIPGLTIFKRSLFKTDSRGNLTRGKMGLPQPSLIDFVSWKTRVVDIATIPALVSAGFWFPLTFMMGGVPKGASFGEKVSEGFSKYYETISTSEGFMENFWNNPSIRDGTFVLGGWIFGILLIIPELNKFKHSAKKVVFDYFKRGEQISPELKRKIEVKDRFSFFFVTSFVQEVVIGLLMGLAIVRGGFSWPANYIDGATNGFAANVALIRNEEIRKEWIDKSENLQKQIDAAREQGNQDALGALLATQKSQKFKTWFYTSFFPSILFLSVIFPIARSLHYISTATTGFMAKFGQQMWLYITGAVFFTERFITRRRSKKASMSEFIKTEWKNDSKATCSKTTFIGLPSFVRPRSY